MYKKLVSAYENDDMHQYFDILSRASDEELKQAFDEYLSSKHDTYNHTEIAVKNDILQDAGFRLLARL